MKRSTFSWRRMAVGLALADVGVNMVRHNMYDLELFLFAIPLLIILIVNTLIPMRAGINRICNLIIGGIALTFLLAGDLTECALVGTGLLILIAIPTPTVFPWLRIDKGDITARIIYAQMPDTLPPKCKMVLTTVLICLAVLLPLEILYVYIAGTWYMRISFLLTTSAILAWIVFDSRYKIRHGNCVPLKMRAAYRLILIEVCFAAILSVLQFYVLAANSFLV